MSAIGRAAAAGVLGALAGAAWLAFFYAWNAELRVGFDVDPPRLVSGVYGAERDEATGLTFAWTGEEVALRLPGLDRRVEWTLTVRARGARPGAAPNPVHSVFVDGVHVHTHAATTEFGDVRVQIPPRPERRGVTVSIRSSDTFIPGPDDPRPLGVMLDAVALKPSGVVLPPEPAFAAAATSGGALAASVALLGVTPGSAIGAAVLLAAGQGAVLSRGFAPYTAYPDIVARLGVVIAVALAAIMAVIRRRMAGGVVRNTARFAAAFSAGALFLKLLVLLHPDMPIGDALFQAHRFQEVLRGNLHFTSIAPGNYLFPYAPGLYVAAAPFAGFVRREMGDVALLRIVVTTADTIAGALLYVVVARRRGDRLAAAMTVAFYHLIPLGFRVIAGGNLTNAFAQSLSVAALAVLGAAWLRWERRWSAALLTVLLAAAFMSHTSTFAILFTSVIAAALLFVWRGGPALRSPARAIAAATAAAVLLAVVLYYAHFMETYRSELSRIGGEVASAAPDAGGRTIGARLEAVLPYLRAYFGIPTLLLAGWGALQLRRQGARDRLTLSIAGWGAACALFLAIGILTPVDMRYYLAAIPAVAILAAVGAAASWKAHGRERQAAAALLLWALWIAFRTWWTTLG
jgi:hypothetical protein